MSSQTRPQPDVPIPLSSQVATCAAFSAVALVIIYFTDARPLNAMPVALWLQCAAGLGLGAAAALASYIHFRFTSGQTSTRNTIDSYSRLDLTGMNPVWISVAAAVGEELLFRAALQPLLGIWIASLLFLLVHAPAYKVRGLNRATLVQAAGVFAVSMLLGLIFEYVGLVAAMLVHAALDIVGLYTIRKAIGTRQA